MVNMKIINNARGDLTDTLADKKLVVSAMECTTPHKWTALRAIGLPRIRYSSQCTPASTPHWKYSFPPHAYTCPFLVTAKQCHPPMET